jgi:hypothetical protein
MGILPQGLESDDPVPGLNNRHVGLRGLGNLFILIRLFGQICL